MSNEPDKIKKELRRFAESTTIKGVGRSVKADRKTVRVFWILALFSCSVLLIYQLVVVLVNYFSYSVIRNSGMTTTGQAFPDITICNTFPLSDLSLLPFYDDYLKKVEAIQKVDPYPNSTFMFTDFMITLEAYVVNSPALSPELSEQALNMLVNLQAQEVLMNGLNTNICQKKTQVVRPLQWCLTITQCQVQSEIIIGEPTNAVEAILTDFSFKIDSVYTLPLAVSAASGLFVMIHAQGTAPDPQTAIRMSPGNEILITLQQTEITRLEQPWGNCTMNRYFNPDAAPDQLLVYDVNSCYSLCIQRQQIKECGCMDENLLFTEEDLLASNYTFCPNLTSSVGADGVIDMAALNKSLVLYQCWFEAIWNQSLCDCPQKCFETQYDTMVTNALWPDPIYHLNFYQTFIRGDPRFGNEFDIYETILNASENQSSKETLRQLKNVELIEENFLKLIVKFNNKNVYLVMDIPAMTWDAFASFLGGSLNLWLGISVPTVAELIELTYLMVMICLENRKKKSSTGVEPNEEVDDDRYEPKMQP